MTHKIIYFTGTGNTAFISEKIASITRQKYGANVLVEPIEEAVKASNKDEGIILGIGYPIYDYMPPLVFMNHLKKVIEQNSIQMAYIFSTYATAHLDSHAHVMQVLKESDIPICGAAHFKAPGACAYLYVSKKNPIAAKQRTFDPKIQKQVEQFVDDVYDHIQNKQELSVDKFHPLNKVHQRLSKLFFGNLFYRNLQVSDQCIGCGLCVKACPVNHLEIEQGILRIKADNGCERCLRCVVACPKEAINFTSSKRHGVYNQKMIPKLYEGNH